MLRLPKFEVHRPSGVDEVLSLLAEHGEDARLLAGGTDLLPNMKHGLQPAGHLISLKGLPELVGITEHENGALSIGALTALQDVADDARVQTRYPALAEACGLVAGPHHRRMGTLGGNVCLDTRCLYYNQTYFWREALGFCLKKDGTVCHVVAGGRRCVAAASNDSAPPLMALGATLQLRSPDGERALSMAELYTADGIRNLNIGRDELLTRVDLPAPAPGRYSAFEKLRIRRSIDFPLINLAAALTLNDDGVITELSLVVGALAARPTPVRSAAGVAVGQKLDGKTIDAIADRAFRQCKPLTNINADPAWRREMVPELARRALQRIAEQTRST